MTTTTPTVEVVVPARDEARVLGAHVRRLRGFLDERFPFPATITIADSASRDATLLVAVALARELAGVEVVHVKCPGRGRALRAAWTASTADVVAYMDADLSTGLDALLPLVAPLLSGHSDVAIGTRLHRSARIVRSTRREVISRAYNALLHVSLDLHASDAQCGFKALRRDACDALLPAVRDEEWFFDTELLVLAERAGLRVHEVPVDWVEDPDSSVDLVRTAVQDLRGVARLRRERAALVPVPVPVPPAASPVADAPELVGAGR